MQTIEGHKYIKKKYLNYIKSQEALSEPFRDKIKQFNNFLYQLVLEFKKFIKKIKKLKLLV